MRTKQVDRWRQKHNYTEFHVLVVLPHIIILARLLINLISIWMSTEELWGWQIFNSSAVSLAEHMHGRMTILLTGPMLATVLCNSHDCHTRLTQEASVLEPQSMLWIETLKSCQLSTIIYIVFSAMISVTVFFLYIPLAFCKLYLFPIWKPYKIVSYLWSVDVTMQWFCLQHFDPFQPTFVPLWP